MKRLLFLLQLAALIPILNGCSGAPFWLQGEWVFDSERTQQELAALNPTPPASPVGSTPAANPFANMMSVDWAKGMTSTLINMIVPQLEGMEVTITSKDFITTVKGEGKSVPYEIIKKSNRECTLKEPDGTVTTYFRDGADIYSFGTGAASTFKFYMKRKS